jgi:hypothetical protein
VIRLISRQVPVIDTGGEGVGDVVGESEDVPLPSEYVVIVVIVATVLKFSARVLSSKYMVSTPFTNKKYIKLCILQDYEYLAISIQK